MSMEYAESLGLGFFCQPCLIALAVWNHELDRWEDEEDDPLNIKVDCPECGRIYTLPTKEEVEGYDDARADYRT